MIFDGDSYLSQLYLQSRMNCKASKMLKHVLQFSVISMAFYTDLSRISDYKHHCEFTKTNFVDTTILNFISISGSDVLAGSFLGTVVAFAVCYGVANLFDRQKLSEDNLSIK